MKTADQKLNEAMLEERRVHVTLTNGTVLRNCTVTDKTEASTFILTRSDGSFETVCRSQLEYVHVIQYR